ncbi:unnamed protein product [Dibothriocephalus latus]|uniref:Uncharacterized protein n=1 Tax=Dibothriocephalus latus TaxID=60516 RepID=A0A3P7NYI4_DIBLA|nr:unnamed protein product [Dibothriocephalus latus]
MEILILPTRPRSIAGMDTSGTSSTLLDTLSHSPSPPQQSLNPLLPTQFRVTYLPKMK